VAMTDLSVQMVVRRPILLAAVILLALGMAGQWLIFSDSVHAQSISPKVIVADVDGAIDPVMARYLTRVIDDAQSDDVALLILRINTPGGLLESTREIVADMLASETPIVTFIGPSGARAASAGTFITVAGGLAAMANSTNIGAASPVGGAGEDIEDTLGRKVTNDAAAFIRSIAEQRGRNAFALERTVRAAAAYTAEEALRENIVDLFALDVDDLLEKLDGMSIPTASGSVEVHTGELSVSEVGFGFVDNILSFLSNPDIVFLFFSLGGLALVVEIWSPGLVGPGVIGVILLLLSFAGLGQLPFHWAGLGLLGLAILLIIAETHAPGFGIFGIAAGASLILGGLLLVGFFGTPEFGDPDFSVSWWLLYGMGGSVAAVAVWFGWIARQARDIPAYVSPHSFEGLVGEHGTVTVDLDPEGEVMVAGERWGALVENEQKLEAGSEIEVSSVQGLVLIVEPGGSDTSQH
jgi:membrane-bound serine protease (ClpP class)